MYTLKITDENTVVTTVKESIVERSNYVDKIQILTSKMYRERNSNRVSGRSCRRYHMERREAIRRLRL